MTVRMRAYRRPRHHGFTLVELMVVVAIIGMLAALAIYGVNRYLKSAKTSEARAALGGISRAAADSYARENAASEILALGSSSLTVVHQLCDSATAVPGFVPKGAKYMPNNNGGNDFDQGTATGGWKCLRFEVDDPTYYQYHYVRNSTALCSAYGCTPATQSPNFEAAALGDLDGDDSYSALILNGEIDGVSKQLKRATVVYVFNEYE